MCVENEICKKQVYDCNVNDIKWLLTENSKQNVFLEDSFLRDDSDASPFFPAKFLLSQGKSGNLKISQGILLVHVIKKKMTLFGNSYMASKCTY